MKKIVFILLFASINSTVFCQVINGTVFDNKTKEIIYSASIYFNGTSAGTLSDQNGKFKIDITKYRSMPLTISAIGYYSVTLNDFSSAKALSVYLNPKMFELTEVVVTEKSHARERRENLTIFRNEFLGTTGNSLNCEITNEDDIRFKYDSGNDTIKAYATKPILIINKALGYRITYYLDKFEYYKQSSSFFFNGNIMFSKDSTGGEAKEKLYEKKRKNAYVGSRMHFFRALWINDLNSAGFIVKNPANETLSYNKIVFQLNDRTKYLRYPGGLGISYYSKQPTSFVVFQKEMIFFDANGYYDASGISWEGEMSRQRIADLLPFDYLPKE
jgi:hypothetical protein